MLFGLTPLALVVVLLGGYLLGSVPFGVLVTRWGGAGDVRAIGSGNIGATNVLRTGRKDLAALTLLGDAGKGVVAVVVARALWGETAGALAGGAAFIGHLFPVWLGFKGGKGVATRARRSCWRRPGLQGLMAPGHLAAGAGGRVPHLLPVRPWRRAALSPVYAALIHAAPSGP